MIKDVRVENGKNHSVIYIDDFSDELEDLIRNHLQNIWNGFSDVKDDLHGFYSYKNTLRFFFDTYDSKKDNIRKGLIGELLAHILIPIYFSNLTSISILKNFEENHIKKGFDIIYYDTTTTFLWYSEAKSGNSKRGKSSTKYNSILLRKSRAGILEMLNSTRDKLWDKARTEVEKTIPISKGRFDIKNLLTKDAPAVKTSKDKNRVILISILFNDLSDLIDPKIVEKFHSKTHEKEYFEDTIILSIQKNTFEAVAKFLKDEITNP